MGVRKTQAGANLKRWFKEKWVDNKGLPCGSDENKEVKKCRPSRKISSKTPKTWGDLGPAGKAKAMREKREVGMGERAPALAKISPLTKRTSCKY